MAEQIEMPWPPTLNKYRTVARGRLITSTKGKKYKDEGMAIIRSQTKAKISGKIKVGIVFHPPTNSRFDLDNFCKCLLDTVTESGLIEDDSNISELKLTKGEKIKGGKALVTITSIEDE